MSGLRCYKAFISYSHSDIKWATWLHKSLESYRVPKHIVSSNNLSTNRLIPVFRDRDDLSLSGDLSATIKTALENSENLIVICSPDSTSSIWVNEEIRQFRALGKSDRIFCLLVDEPAKSFPPALIVGEDENSSSNMREPVAADVRPDADGKRGAILKIVASLLGIEFDHLRRRETQRRYRRLLFIALAALVGMILSIGLARYAFQQQQRAEAEAETSRQVTEFLLSAFRMSDPNYYRSSEPTAGEVLQQGALRLRHELRDHPKVRARMLSTIGSAYLGLSRYDEAEILLREALELQEQQYGLSAPELVTTMRNLASVEGSIAELEPSGELFERVIEIQEQQGLKSAVADTLLKWSRFVSDSLPVLLRALALIEVHEPQSKLHGRILLELAYASFDAGEVEQSLEYHRMAVALHKSEGHQQLLIGSMNGLGGVLAYMGKADQSLLIQKQVVSFSEDYYGVDHPYTATRINDLAVSYHLSGDLDKARPLYRHALSISEKYLGAHSGLRKVLLVNLGELERDMGAYPEAESLFNEAAQSHRETRGKVPAYLVGQIALLLLAQKQYEEAQIQFDRYFAYFDSTDINSNPSHIPIIEGFKRMQLETGQKFDVK